ncbi:MAG TPA: 5-formyltetrahydrofolate cyclo-ligase [Deinococcales bacterium]|nr:5-formyltetrahydrofolate cyclo-ligase [Deinococcales bacterium]
MELPGPRASKAEWRAWARAARASLPNVSEAVCEIVAALLAELRPGTVLAYRAFGSETTLDALPPAFPAARWLAPRVGDGRLSLHGWDAPTERGPFGIRQARADAEAVAPEEADVVLVPGLVYDEGGYRLGYGGGYYDRLLPLLRHDAVTFGVARDELLVPALPRDGWDVPVREVVTQSRLLPAARPDR